MNIPLAIKLSKVSKLQLYIVANYGLSVTNTCEQNS